MVHGWAQIFPIGLRYILTRDTFAGLAQPYAAGREAQFFRIYLLKAGVDGSNTHGLLASTAQCPRLASNLSCALEWSACSESFITPYPYAKTTADSSVERG